MTDEQAGAFAQVRRLAAPLRLRVVADAEGFPIVHGRLGDVEYFHPEGTHLAAYTAGRLDRLGRLLSLPGIIRHQVGDSECRVLFPVAMIAEIARVIRARTHRKGRPMTTAQAHALRQARISSGSGGSESTISPVLEVQVEAPHPRAPQAGHQGVSVLVIEVAGKVL